MTEATKRPWGYVHHKGLGKHLVGAVLENVAIVEDRHSNAKENAELIVKAVNSIGNLTFALVCAEADIEGIIESGLVEGDHPVHKTLKEIRRALA